MPRELRLLDYGRSRPRPPPLPSHLPCPASHRPPTHFNAMSVTHLDLTAPAEPTIPDDLYTPRKHQSHVWLYFKLSLKVKRFAWCCVEGCPDYRRRVSRPQGTTTNLLDHLKKWHPRLADSPSTPASASSPSIRELLKASTTAPCTESFQRELDDLVARAVVANGLSLHVVDSPEFVRAFHFATNRSYIPLSRHKLTSTLDLLYQSMTEALLADMRNNAISITSDAATLDNGSSYITVTAHYITAQWQLRNVALLVSRMQGSHTGEYVSDLLDMTVQAWEAEGRVFAAVTDNGANFVKAARINSHINDELRCICHTLQLALKDAVHSQVALQQLCHDAQELVVTIRRSSHLSGELQDIQRQAIAAAADADGSEGSAGADPQSRPLRLAMNVATRFNSLCILFSRLHEVRPHVQRLCLANAAELAGKALSVEQWQEVEELVSVLSPVKEMCDLMEASSSPSLSLLIPLVQNVLQILYDLQCTLKTVSCRSVCDAVRTAVQQRTLSSLQDKTVQIAMALDPRVRTKLLPNYDRTLSLTALKDAFAMFLPVFGELRGRTAELRASPAERKEEVMEGPSAPPPAKRQRSVMDLQDDCATQVPVSELEALAKEGGISMEECPLLWWASRAAAYPVLSQMARVYLAVPASSAASERVFSTGTLVLGDRRRRLDESRVARLMFMKHNMKLYDLLKLTKGK